MKCPDINDLPKPLADKIGWPWTEASNHSEWINKRTEWPKVSIVMPSYNQGAYIEESIRSVLLQGYPDLEFFVYDAVSTDGGADIIRKYSPWFACWASEKDRGQSDAINKGLRKSTGKYFNWQNSDDVLTPCCLFKAVDALLEHPEASHVHGYRDVIYANGELHSTSENTFGSPTRLAPEVAPSISLLKTGTQPGGLMDRELVMRVGGIDESMHFVMDMDILLKLSVIRPPLYVHEKLVSYRFHDDIKSYSSWTKERRFEKLRLVKNLYKMPEAEKYAACRREAMSTAYRYAADCAWMSGDIWGFIYNIVMDVIWTPFKGWDRRRALLYYIKERKKGLKMGAQG